MIELTDGASNIREQSGPRRTAAIAIGGKVEGRDDGGRRAAAMVTTTDTESMATDE